MFFKNCRGIIGRMKVQAINQAAMQPMKIGSKRDGVSIRCNRLIDSSTVAICIAQMTMCLGEIRAKFDGLLACVDGVARPAKNQQGGGKAGVCIGVVGTNFQQLAKDRQRLFDSRTDK